MTKTSIIIDEPKPMTLRELEEYGKYALGFKLLVKCLEGTYSGICHQILPNSRQLLLEKVSICSLGKRKIGLAVLFYMDIISIKFIGVDHKTRNKLWKEFGLEKSSANVALMGQILPPTIDDDATEGGSMKLEGANSLLPHFPTKVIRDVKWTIVDSFGVDYERCMHDCKSSLVVSLAGFGQNLGRNGQLIWLALETRECVYLFDIPTLGGVSSMLESALGKLFGDASVVKVVHDGRRLLDFLDHRHSFHVSNVFDTQASDIYLGMSQHNEMPILVRTLPALLNSYLEFEKYNVDNLIPFVDDESRWLERPLPTELSILMVHSVMFLRKLRTSMVDLIHRDLKHLNDLFLSSLKTRKSDDDFDEMLVPLDILSLHKSSLLPSSMRKRFNKNY